MPPIAPKLFVLLLIIMNSRCGDSDLTLGLTGSTVWEAWQPEKVLHSHLPWPLRPSLPLPSPSPSFLSFSYRVFFSLGLSLKS